MAKKVYKLDEDMLKVFVGIAIDKYKEEETTAIRTWYDKKRANTKILLRNYRSLMDHCESAIYDAAQMEEEANLAEILELMSGDSRESFRIESICESAVRTRLIVDHINEMLTLYQIYCERSTKQEDKRRYRVIFNLYITDEPLTAEQIAEEEFVEQRTIYRDVDAAIERLTALIFGIDGLYLLKK